MVKTWNQHIFIFRTY